LKKKEKDPDTNWKEPDWLFPNDSRSADETLFAVGPRALMLKSSTTLAFSNKKLMCSSPQQEGPFQGPDDLSG
jgi:hypothetical protein